MPKVELVDYTQNPVDKLCKIVAVCYQNVSGRVTEKVLEHILRAGHWSVLEHCYATFKIKCSIVVLMQLTRHRHFSFTCQSSRGSVIDTYYVTGEGEIDSANDSQMDEYKDAVNSGFTDEKAAYLLPKAAEYELYVTGNFRTWLEYLPKRLCKRASKEHRELAQLIYEQLQLLVCPFIFRDEFCKPKCKDCNESRCSFHA